MSNKTKKANKPQLIRVLCVSSKPKRKRSRYQIIKLEYNNNSSDSPLLNGKAKTETKPGLNYKLDKERKYKVHDTATRQCLI